MFSAMSASPDWILRVRAFGSATRRKSTLSRNGWPVRQ
jgi:hypothetical protein